MIFGSYLNGGKSLLGDRIASKGEDIVVTDGFLAEGSS